MIQALLHCDLEFILNKGRHPQWWGETWWKKRVTCLLPSHSRLMLLCIWPRLYLSLLKWHTLELLMKDTLNKGHLCIKDIFQCTNLYSGNTWKRTTSPTWSIPMRPFRGSTVLSDNKWWCETASITHPHAQDLEPMALTLIYGPAYHKGAIAPLYIGMTRVGQHHSHTFGKSTFPWQ